MSTIDPKTPKVVLSVIAPCYNEEDNINELVNRCINLFDKRGLNAELILVNDGSSDKTGALIDSQTSDRIIPVHHKKNQGMEAAWKSGLEAAQGAYTCIIDSDLQYQPEDIWRLYREIIHKKCDIVQGYRSSIGRLKDERNFFSVTLNSILNISFGMRSKDNKSGFILCPKDVMEDILTHKFKYSYFQTFITVSAHSKGYSISEVETLFESRILGESFIKGFPLGLILNVFWDIFLGFIEFRFLNKKSHIIKDFLDKTPLPKPYKPTLSKLRSAHFWIYTRFMPLHHWLISSQARIYYQYLDKSQWLSSKDIQKMQEKRLRFLIHHAYHHVGYYKEKMDAHNLNPSDIRTLEDLEKLPMLGKQDVRDNLYFDLLSDNHNKKYIQRITTSGSTGNPFVCYVDKQQLEMRWAATLRGLQMSGYRFGQRVVRLWHQKIGMSRKQVFKEKCDAFFSRRSFIPVFELTDSNIKKMISKLKRIKPTLIDGYAEAFNLIAQFLKQNEESGISVKSVVSSAQMLPAESRAKIEQYFDTNVYDKYGSREFSGIAYQCEEKDGYHIVAENYIVEILKDGKPAKPGETGEVVITDLNNYCMPFIRYRIGDLATAADNSAPCKCGRGLPKIQNVQGRVQSIIIAANGRYIPGTFFSHLFKEYYFCVKQYQVVQETLGSITLNVVKADRFTDDTFSKILSELKQYLGEHMEIAVNFTDNIELTKTGKHQAVLSKIPIDFQEIDVAKTAAEGKNK